MKRLILLSTVFISIVSPAQFVVKKLKEVDTWHKDHVYIFPLLTSKTNPAAANKINDDLVKDFLQTDRKKIRRSIFENVWMGKKDYMPPLSDISYEVLNNDKGIFSIAISAEGCAAYCENFTMYYSYDAKTGKRIVLDKLVTTAGATRLLDSVKQRKTALIEGQIKLAEDSLRVIPEARGDDKDYYLEMLELYQNCLADSYQPVLSNFYFYLTRTKLVIILERCSAHYNRNADELEGRFVFDYSLKEWNNYLTDYTKKLIR